MLERMRFAAEQQVPPKTIWGICFTKRNALELSERAARLCIPGFKALKLSTFHSVPNMIVMQNHQLLGFTASPLSWGADADRKAIVKEAIRWDLPFHLRMRF